ncbi:MAG: class I SAM-dependent rRNA methyltransferase [Anaerolineae bacterium]
MATVRLKPGKDKAARNRHPWIFGGAIASVQGSPQPGDIVDVHDHANEFLARGYYNPQSQIVMRLLTWQQEDVGPDFWRHRLQAALRRRENLAQDPATDAYRMVFAESDGLPGLIVDRYADWLVLQSLTLGIERWKPLLANLLMELAEPRGIYERSDVDVRGHEGLKAATGVLAGENPAAQVIVQEQGLRFGVDLRLGHKTGLYLDQRDNRRRVAAYSSGREVLNVFAYTGGFAVYAASQGAARVANLDSSADALQAAHGNMALNALARDTDDYVVGDAFQVLRRYRSEEQRYDLVILDPPKFAFSRGQLTAATRGYKDINMLGMQLLRPGGYLATFSCSGLVSEDLFQKVLFGASVDVGREVRILERLGQGADHPVLLTFPEAAYLKGFICLVE